MRKLLNTRGDSVIFQTSYSVANPSSMTNVLSLQIESLQNGFKIDQVYPMPYILALLDISRHFSFHTIVVK